MGEGVDSEKRPLPAWALRAGCLMLAVACLSVAALPPGYVATARVFLPPQADGKSRIREIREEAGDAHAAAQRVGERMQSMLDKKTIVLDEPAVSEQRGYRWLAGPGLAFLLLFLKQFFAARARRARVPDRSVVREAIMLAQRGHKTALVDNGARFRVVLADNAPDREELRVLARLAGGALVLARRS